MKIAICAALYEAGRPYLDAFSAAVTAAAAGHDAVFVAAIDGLADARLALAGLGATMEIVAATVGAGHSPAGVRRAMLAAGQASGADILVFIDMDDAIAPDALDRHLVALARADFSYGDLVLIDAGGAPLGRQFFDRAGVPDTIGAAPTIAERNFLGFSNTAVWASRIAPVALAVPDDVVAADWWFFTMLLLGGLGGRRTAAPVAAYRLHGTNTLGAGAPQTVAALTGQIEALRRHYRAFSAQPGFAARARETERALQVLHHMSEAELAALVRGDEAEAGVWFEHAGRIAARLADAPAATALAQ